MKNYKTIPLICAYITYCSWVSLQFIYLPSYFVTILHASGKDVAMIFAGVTIINMLAQPIWGQLADSTQKLVNTMRWSVALSLLPLLPLLWYHQFWVLFVCLWWLALCIAPMQSLLDTMTLGLVGMDGYGNIRLWGSIAYGSCAMLFPAQYLHWVLPGSLLCLLLCLTSLYFLREMPHPAPLPSRQIFFIELMRNRPFVLLLLFGLVHWCSHTPYHMIMDIHRRDLLLGPHVTGYAVAAGIFGECMMLVLSPRWLPMAALRHWIMASAALSALRWAVMSHAVSAPVFVGIQVLHGFSYGVFFVASLAYLTQIVPRHMIASGQTVFSAVVFGGGTIWGNIYTGVLLDCEGRGLLAFGAAACFASMAVVLSLWIPPCRAHTAAISPGNAA